MVATVSLHEQQNVKKQVLELLSSWGKNTVFRYLRDHHQLESFIERLPLRNYEESDGFVIQKTLLSLWDNFTVEGLAAMKAWQRANFDASLGKKVYALALDFERRGMHEACLEVLRIGSSIDRVESSSTVQKKVCDLNVDDVVIATAAGVGFGSRNLPGTVTDKTASVEGTYAVRVETSDGETYRTTYDGGEAVTVQSMVKNRLARSLKTQALDKLLRAQLLADTSLQPRIARLRYALEQEIEEME